MTRIGKTILLALLLLASCSPSSLEGFRNEGEKISKRLITDLQKIQTREDLIDKETLLKHRFISLVDVMIAAREFQEEHPNAAVPEVDEELSESLCLELQRVCSLEGGRDLIEASQREALIRLDAFEKKLMKERQKIPK